MGVHRILSKCDDALVAYLLSLSIGDADSVYPAKRADDRENPPFIVIMSTEGRPEHPYSGSYRVQVQIATHTRASKDVDEESDTLKEASNDLASDVDDAFFRFGPGEQSGTSLAEEITAAAQGAGLEFTALDCLVIEVEQGRSGKQGEWVDTISLEVLCVPSNI